MSDTAGGVYIFPIWMPSSTQLLLFLVNVSFLLAGPLGDLTSLEEIGNLGLSSASSALFSKLFSVPALFTSRVCWFMWHGML